MLTNDSLLLEDGAFENGETYRIKRLHGAKSFDDLPYRLHLDNGDTKRFRTMIHAQYYVQGYAEGKGTAIKKSTRINC